MIRWETIIEFKCLDSSFPKLILSLKLDKRFPFEQFEATVSQSTVQDRPPLLIKRTRTPHRSRQAGMLRVGSKQHYSGSCRRAIIGVPWCLRRLSIFSNCLNMLLTNKSPQAKHAETDPRHGTPTRAHFQLPELQNNTLYDQFSEFQFTTRQIEGLETPYLNA